jgi:V-type H+-transporting ATPase proteolipid subunit
LVLQLLAGVPHCSEDQSPYRLFFAYFNMSASPELMTGLGAALAIFLSSAGACAASAPAGIYAMRTTSAHGVIKAFIPIVIGGVLAIYGIIIAVILSYKIEDGMAAITGYKCFASGLSVGLACLASGLSMAKFLQDYMAVSGGASKIGGGRANVGSAESQPLLEGIVTANGGLSREFLQPSWTFFCVYTFLEAIGLYGLIVALLLAA